MTMHDMEKFPALLALCEQNPPVMVDYPHNGSVMWSIDVFVVVNASHAVDTQWLLDVCHDAYVTSLVIYLYT